MNEIVSIEQRKLNYLLKQAGLSMIRVDALFKKIDEQMSILLSGNYEVYAYAPYGPLNITDNISIHNVADGTVLYKSKYLGLPNVISVFELDIRPKRRDSTNES